MNAIENAQYYDQQAPNRVHDWEYATNREFPIFSTL